jgi:hypothetical protein
MVYFLLLIMNMGLYSPHFVNAQTLQNQSNCTAILDEAFIHGAVTNAPNSSYRYDFEEINRYFRNGIAGTLPSFDTSSIIKGEKSLLSLGEGESQFVLTLLRARRRWSHQTQLPTIMAVDAAYIPGIKNKIDISTEINPMKFFGTEFGGNYKGFLYQNLDIRDANGNTVHFDYIISRNSLSFVLSGTPRLQEAKEILDKVVDHLNPGGLLILMPLSMKDRQKLEPLLVDLRTRGIIQNYSTIAPHAVIIQRATTN